MEFKGTKGEWIIQGNFSILIGHECEYLWSYSGRNANFKSEVLANAKLIAAAPDLLDALLKLIDPQTGLVYDAVEKVTNKETCYKIEKAIEKALNK